MLAARLSLTLYFIVTKLSPHLEEVLVSKLMSLMVIVLLALILTPHRDGASKRRPVSQTKS